MDSASWFPARCGGRARRQISSSTSLASPFGRRETSAMRPIGPVSTGTRSRCFGTEGTLTPAHQSHPAIRSHPIPHHVLRDPLRSPYIRSSSTPPTRSTPAR